MLLSKLQKSALIKVCKVLFPEYPHMTISGDKVKFRKSNIPFISWFMTGWKISLSELINYRIPLQLADFKYNNKTFIGVVQNEMVQCELTNEDVIAYFFNEIASVKYADLYKQANVIPSSVKLISSTSLEEEMYDSMIQMYERQDAKRPSFIERILFIDVNYEVLFYFSLFLLVAYVCLTSIRV